MTPTNDVLSVFSQINDATVDGAKAGIAANVASEITEAVVSATGVTLPAIFTSGRGKVLLPLLVCYGIVFLTALLPGIPKADVVRKVCIFAAKGTATIAVQGLLPDLTKLSRMIVGIGLSDDNVKDAAGL